MLKFFSIPTLFILLAVAMGVVLVGGFEFGKLSTPGPDLTAAGLCCDSGDGDACKPNSEKNLTYNGTQYGLLKAQVDLIEGNLHIRDSGQTFQGNPIIVNSSQDHLRTPPPGSDPNNIQAINNACQRPNPTVDRKDLYFKRRPSDPYMFMRTAQPPSVVAQYCTSIPDDELIFVCRQNCHAATCSFPVDPSLNISCYGDSKTVYDVYFRLSDYSSSGVPDFIKNCEKTASTTGTASKKVINLPAQPQRQNLQLQTFGFNIESINPGLSPFCKPAIYLYPKTESNVSVQVNPAGPITYSIPQYPNGGWNVIATPNGKITTSNASFDYLYYESEIPDSKIEKPTDGFVVKKDEVKSLLENILPQLGLNNKEKDQFIEYWTNVLPSSPYFFIGVVSQKTLNSIAPLSISPKPDTIIRVTLYFEALDTYKTAPTPLISPIARKGFSVVEWGGIFKRDKNHPFFCFM